MSYKRLRGVKTPPRKELQKGDPVHSPTAKTLSPARPLPPPLVSFAGELPIGERLSGRLCDDKYAIISELSQGGMGVVYKAMQLTEGFEVVIKTIHEQHVADRDAVKYFRRELRAMIRAQAIDDKRLRHIVQVLDYGQYEGTPFIVMEHVKGIELRGVIDLDEVALTRAIHIALQICDGLTLLHYRGIIHRDLKPENILLVEGQESDLVKICDFGSVTFVGVADPLFEVDALYTTSGNNHTGPGSIAGTLGYMPLEQIQGSSYHPTVDIYALGVILYEIICDLRPFSHGFASVAEAIRARQFNPPNLRRRRPDLGIPEELDHVVMRALEKYPQNRYQSAAEFAIALSATLPYL